MQFFAFLESTDVLARNWLTLILVGSKWEENSKLAGASRSARGIEIKYKAYAATMQSVWFSEDEGNSSNRLLTPTGGFYNEARVWSVNTHSDRPGEVLAGTDQGLYRFSEATGRFEYIPSPIDQLHFLRIAQDPCNANFIVCGTRLGEIFISEDNGCKWTRANLDASTECWFINTSRVTLIHFDPHVRDTIWITVEIDGVFRSPDRGKTWQQVVLGLHDNDTHDLSILQTEWPTHNPLLR